MKSLTTRHFDAVIVGAGIPGLALGRMLRASGLRVQVLDQLALPPFDPQPGFDTRIYALSAGSRRVLEQAGAWNGLDPERVVTLAGMEIHGDGGGYLDFASPAPDQPLGYIVEASAILAALNPPASHLTGRADPPLLQAPQSVISVETVPQGLRLHLEHGPALHTTLLVAADGANSPLRQRMGITTHSVDYDHSAVVVNYRIGRPHGDLARQWFKNGEVIALLPLPGARVSLVWSARRAHASELLSLTPAQRCAAVQQLVGAEFPLEEEIGSAAAFPLRRMRPSSWVLPRFALLGDAAHGVHPLAGQGLNLGLQDVATLARILNERGPGPDCGDLSLLRRYARSRSEPVLAMQTLTAGLYHLFGSESSGGMGWLRNRGLTLVQHWPWLKQRLIEHANA